MRQYIVLSQADIITLLKNKPVSVYVNDVKYIMCSDKCYEQDIESDDISHIFDNVTQEEFEKVAKAIIEGGEE